MGWKAMKGEKMDKMKGAENGNGIGKNIMEERKAYGLKQREAQQKS